MIVFEAGRPERRLKVWEDSPGSYSANFGLGAQGVTRERMEARLAKQIYATQRRRKVRTPWGPFRPYTKSGKTYPRGAVATTSFGDVRGHLVSPVLAVVKEPGANRHLVVHRPTGVYALSLENVAPFRALAAAEFLSSCVKDPEAFASADLDEVRRALDVECVRLVGARAFLT